MENSSGFNIEGLLMGALSLVTWKVYIMSKKADKFEEAYWGERRGRARVEREMKRIADIRLNTSGGFFVQPIGTIKSCYRQCIGTPRQGLLVPASRSSVTLTRNVSPEALVGLEAFSHVWLTFKFHLNTNTLKESKAFSGRSTFVAKINLPVLKDNTQHKKVGVLASRSPHRPNPVGITLARIWKVDKKTRTVYLQACDLVEGTPILDIKPYVAAYDTVPDYKVPDWIADTVHIRNTVTPFTQATIDYVHTHKRRLVQYKDEPEEFLNGLRETLEADIRSTFQTNKRMYESTQGLPVEVPFDEMMVKYFWREGRSLEVVGIELASQSATAKRERELKETQALLAERNPELAALVDNEEGGEEIYDNEGSECSDADSVEVTEDERAAMVNNKKKSSADAKVNIASMKSGHKQQETSPTVRSRRNSDGSRAPTETDSLDMWDERVGCGVGGAGGAEAGKGDHDQLTITAADSMCITAATV